MGAIYPWQQNNWARLQELRKRPPNGILFKGIKGIGKLDLAIKFGQSLLCQHPDESGFACGKCPSCHWFGQGSHPDYRLLQPEVLSLEGEETETGKKPSKQISVDQVRGLADFVSMSAHQGGGRVVVIHPAEAMNANAANALLKNLEEPPQGLLFILVSHKPQQLLPTILSRCLPFALSAPDAASATRWLAQQGVKNPDAALAFSGFAPLQAVQLEKQLGSEEREKLLRAVRQPAALDVFALAEALQKTEQVLVVQWLQQWSYDLSSMKQAGKLRYHPGEEAAIKKLVEPVAPLNLARLQKHLQTAKREAQHTLNPKLFFESLLFAYRQMMLE
ncbi:MAG: DNA polymerase III subunit delta' [Gallionellales bacterium RIFCSPLOWO2_02_FULL_57_47]|nr:MAG: DNA polymerase III subunit delta' [Gallionellales bacterium RIFCSPLOWO2_02_FULL_57_47]OGT17675.1 MAG: DNA polymerase III subunit delta' [Gallionellales bacterium RIFCSPHIGHO2_02_FULL_57_16]